jgi:SepF-like predicted cell division protein (DUF552 family)
MRVIDLIRELDRRFPRDMEVIIKAESAGGVEEIDNISEGIYSGKPVVIINSKE